MTRDHDIERVLNQWFAESPTQMPGRFLDDTLDRIDRAPQRRLAGLRPRLLAMNTNQRFAAAAAVVLLIAGVGFAVVSRTPAVGVNPSPTPTAVPSASPRAIVDPALLRSKWTSVGVRMDPIFLNPHQIDFVIDSTTLSIDQFKGPVDSTWSLAEPYSLLSLRMRSTQTSLTSGHWDCQPDQDGSYIVGLSSDGRTLTLTPVTDACRSRATILAGDWTRWPCPNPLSTCQTELSPGRHVSSFMNMDPNVPATSSTFLTGYSYSVPVGWSQLESQNALGRPNDPGTMAVTLTLDVAPHSQAPDCPDAKEPGVPTTVAAMAQWLTRVPGLVATTPTPINIGGYDGLMLDVSVAPTWRLTCQFTSGAERIVFTFTDRVPVADSPFVRDTLLGDAHSRYILLDLGGGHNLLIEVGAPDKASWEDLVQAAMPIVNSFQFTR